MTITKISPENTDISAVKDMLEKHCENLLQGFEPYVPGFTWYEGNQTFVYIHTDPAFVVEGKA